MTEVAEHEEMQAVSKEALLAKRRPTPTGFPEDWLTIPDVGPVHFRGLSRYEVLYIQKVAKTVAEVEQITVSHAMLAPILQPEDVKAWQKISTGGELDKVTARIAEMSDMGPNAAKQAYQEFEADPASEFRSLPGGEAVDDSGAATHGTEPAA